MVKEAENPSEMIDLSAMDRVELEAFAMEKHKKSIVLEAQLKAYEELLRKNKKNMFGSSSERYVSEEQMSIFNEAEENADPDTEEPKKLDVLPPTRRKKKKGHKKEQTARLPKEQIEYTLTDEELVCPKCSSDLEDMKTIVRSEIEVIPAQYKVTEHRTKVYSCRACDKKGTEGTIISAPSPKGMFRNSLASPSMVADIIWKKYGLAQPLNRQSQELKRLGINISRGTHANWVINASFMYLRPIWDHMRDVLLKVGVIHADETPVTVLKEPGRDASQQSYMWMYRTGKSENKQVVLFEYAPGRGAEYPEAFLKGFSGYMHCDGYSSYRVLTKESGTGPPKIKIVGCLSHARRKFTDVISGLPKNAAIKGTVTDKALVYIQELFKIEEKAKEMSPSDRLQYRKEKAEPLMDEYFSWLKSIKDKCSGSLSTAVNYSLNQEDDLRVYLEDGRLEISNNLGENAIRPFCVGRKNWLFSDTPAGAEASAVCYGIIETAKANGLDPYGYLKYIFSVFKDADIDSLDMEEFMPWSESLPDDLILLDNVQAS